MMYTFPNKLRNLAIAFMVIGFLGLAYGFITAPSTIEEAKAHKVNLLNCWKEDIEIKFGTATATSGEYAFQSIKLACDALRETGLELVDGEQIAETARSIKSKEELINYLHKGAKKELFIGVENEKFLFNK